MHSARLKDLLASTECCLLGAETGSVQYQKCCKTNRLLKGANGKTEHKLDKIWKTYAGMH